ncbi:hypothetical protein B1H42_06015 [Enterobacter cloacae subsp. cloacae]|nr:hypothetical protein B1H42_06015 [Enterobacter cloacae subsp. cloacae]ORC32030.1 hypothetical protein B2M05_04795 [Enterobacter cloacae subsp. cloacae]
MSRRISDDHKTRLNRLMFDFKVTIERSIDGFKILGLCNSTEPRAKDLESAISLAEKECKRIYGKYM